LKLLNKYKEKGMPVDVVETDLQLPFLEVVSHLCKGCTLCITHCPQKCIELTDHFNELGYQHAAYKGTGCTGCGVCFYSCPEPGAIIVHKKVREKK
jgi:NAD-dependent dihydropyrimidine dehydrogenase PreA subunit